MGGCFNPKNHGLSFCLAIDEIQNNIEKLNPSYSFVDMGNKYYKNKCLYDINNGEKKEEREDFNPNGLSIDVLFVFNNLYKDIKLMAKIPLSDRSKYLVNFDLTPNIYATKKEIEQLIELINSYGP